MSVEWVRWVHEECRRVRGTDKAVLESLAYHAEDDGTCSDLTLDDLAEDCGWERRTVVNSLQRLSDGGYVVISAKRGQGGCNHYALQKGSAAGAPSLHPDSAGDALSVSGDRAPDAPPEMVQEMHSAPDAPSLHPDSAPDAPSLQGDSAPAAPSAPTVPPVPPSSPREESNPGNNPPGPGRGVQGGTQRQRNSSGGAKPDRPKGVNLAPLFEEFTRQGVVRPEILRHEEGYAGELLTKYGASAVVGCWKDIGDLGKPSDFADLYTQRRRSFKNLALDGTVGTWVSWVQAGRLPLSRKGNGYGSGPSDKPNRAPDRLDVLSGRG